MFDHLTAVSFYYQNRCLNCHTNRRSTEETDLVLGLPLELSDAGEKRVRRLKLEDLIDKKFDSEYLEDLRCENCNRVGCWRDTFLEATPEMLCININRSSWSFANVQPRQYKVHQPVLIPNELDLAKYFQVASNGTSKYRLYAVVKHRGDAGSGHFVAWAKCPKDWYELNDRQCTRSTLGQAKRQETPPKGKSERDIFTPTMLFYARAPYAEDGIDPLATVVRAPARTRAQHNANQVSVRTIRES